MKNKEIQNKGIILMFILIVLGFIVCSINEEVQKQKPIKILTEEQKIEQKVQAQFSNWDGSHIELTKIIKSAMNDPKSYEHVSTEYIEFGGIINVYTRFRGRNILGGTVINELRARFNLDGELIEIVG